jgi:hypothetical protein
MISTISFADLQTTPLRVLREIASAVTTGDFPVCLKNVAHAFATQYDEHRRNVRCVYAERGQYRVFLAEKKAHIKKPNKGWPTIAQMFDAKILEEFKKLHSYSRVDVRSHGYSLVSMLAFLNCKDLNRLAAFLRASNDNNLGVVYKEFQDIERCHCHLIQKGNFTEILLWRLARASK